MNNQKQMSKGVKILIGILLFVGLVVAGTMLILSRQTILKEIQLDNDRIITLYSVVGKRKVAAITALNQDGQNYKTIIYKPGVVLDDDFDLYIQALEQKGFVITETKQGFVQLGNESIDGGNDIILVEINHESNGEIIIKYIKTTGIINRN